MRGHMKIAHYKYYGEVTQSRTNSACMYRVIWFRVLSLVRYQSVLMPTPSLLQETATARLYKLKLRGIWPRSGTKLPSYRRAGHSLP